MHYPRFLGSLALLGSFAPLATAIPLAENRFGSDLKARQESVGPNVASTGSSTASTAATSFAGTTYATSSVVTTSATSAGSSASSPGSVSSAASAAITSGASTDTAKVVGAYYGSWKNKEETGWSLKDIPYENLTHVYYAFMYTEDDGTVGLGDPVADVYPGDKATQAVSVGTIRPTAAPPVDSKNYPPTDGIVDYTTSSKFKKSSGDAKMDHGLGWFKANQDIVKDTKIILAVGGDTWSDQFNLAFKNPDNIDNFVSSAIKLVTDNELDGIDIDWEHWFQNEVSDADNLVTLMKKLREGFNKLQDKQYTLTFAAPTLTDDSVTKFTKSFKEMKQHIDWINLMAYDFAGSWEKTYRPGSALIADKTENAIYSGEGAIAQWKKMDYAEDQIVLGIPAYGHAFQYSVPNLKSEKDITEQVPANIQGTWDKGTSPSVHTGIFDYSHIGMLKTMEPNANGTKEWVHLFNPDTAASTLVNTNQNLIITYDCVHAAQKKFEWTSQNNLRGMFLWEASQDRSGELVRAMKGEIVNSDPPKVSLDAASSSTTSQVVSSQAGSTEVKSTGAATTSASADDEDNKAVGSSVATTDPSSTASLTSKASGSTAIITSAISATVGVSGSQVQAGVTSVSGSAQTGDATSSSVALAPIPTDAQNFPATTSATADSDAISYRCVDTMVQIRDHGVWRKSAGKCSLTCGSADAGSWQCQNGSWATCQTWGTWTTIPGATCIQ